MDAEPDDERRRLVANERAKLTATFLNGVAIAMAAVGGFAPLSSSLLAEAALTFRGGVAIIFTFVMAVVMHAIARRLLGSLKP